MIVGLGIHPTCCWIWPFWTSVLIFLLICHPVRPVRQNSWSKRCALRNVSRKRPCSHWMLGRRFSTTFSAAASQASAACYGSWLDMARWWPHDYGEGMWRLHYWVPPTYNLQKWVPLLIWLIIWLTKVFGGITRVYSSWLHFFPWHALLHLMETLLGSSTLTRLRMLDKDGNLRRYGMLIYFFRHGRCCKHHRYPTGKKNNPVYGCVWK